MKTLQDLREHHIQQLEMLKSVMEGDVPVQHQQAIIFNTLEHLQFVELLDMEIAKHDNKYH